MTITLDPPATRPVDFDRLRPFESSESPTRSQSGTVATRRPGEVGGVSFRPLTAEWEPTGSASVPGVQSRWSLRTGMIGKHVASWTVPMDPAIAKRRAEIAKSRPRVSARVAASALALGGVVLGVAMLYSPWMAVRVVEVEGGTPSVAAQVKAFASSKVGTPMIRFGTDQLRRDIRIQPDIATVEVTKHWPERITIAITVREPFARVSVDGGTLRLVDRSGAILPARETGPLPVIALSSERTTDSAATNIDLEDGTNARRSSALAILASLDDETRREVDRVDHFGEEFVLRVGTANILVGRPDDLTAKATLIGSLRRSQGLPDSGTIDVTIPDAVILSK